MATLTPLTLRLAEALGLYMVAAGILMLRRPATIARMLGELETSAMLTFTAGLTGWTIGTAILLVHHHLSDPLAAIVTLIGAFSFVEGLVVIALPEPLLRIVRLAAPYGRAWGAVSLALGAALFLAGLTGRADAIPQGAI